MVGQQWYVYTVDGRRVSEAFNVMPAVKNRVVIAHKKNELEHNHDAKHSSQDVVFCNYTRAESLGSRTKVRSAKVFLDQSVP